MEGRTSRSLSELAEEGAGEENSLLGNREGEKVTSLDTLVPEEEVEAPLAVNQVQGIFYWSRPKSSKMAKSLPKK